MKKLLLFMGIVLCIASCKSKTGQKTGDTVKVATAATPSDSIQITLNGIYKNVADTMRNHFAHYKGQDTHPIQNSVWFDSATIHHMYNLLLKESGPQPAPNHPYKLGQTDGFRIYFISDTTIKTGKLQNTIALVSTKYAGPDPKDNTMPTHTDYYTHAKNDPLFQGNLDSIKGKVSKRPLINFIGENLYNLHYKKDDITGCGDPHYITRRKGFMMVNQYYDHPDTIQTTSEWFDMNLLKGFADDKKHDGVRIYFSRHIQNYYGTPDTDYRKEAFILITTKYKKVLGKEYHVDYFDCHTEKGLFLLHPRGGTGGDGGDDNGEICPTHCNVPKP